MKVLYLMGYGRSGSTLLGRILGEVDGFFCGGEVMAIWRRGWGSGYTCSCGHPVVECPFWSKVLTLGFGGRIRPEQVAAWQDELLVLRRIRPFLRLLRQEPGRPSRWPALDGYGAAMTRLYSAVAEAAQTQVVVDSSKAPAGAAVLALLPDVEPYFVHLVRDPRAVAYSFGRRKRQPTPHGCEELARVGPLASAIRWIGNNAAAEAITRRYGRGRGLLIRYEDFVRDPETTVRTIVNLVGEDPDKSPFVSNRSVILNQGHTVAGNPDRFRVGDVEVRMDVDWTSQLPFVARLLVTSLTIPGLVRYGYPVAASRG